MSEYKSLNSSKLSSEKSSDNPSGTLNDDLDFVPTEELFLTHPENALWRVIGRSFSSAIIQMLFSHCFMRLKEKLNFLPTRRKAFSALVVMSDLVRLVFASKANSISNSGSSINSGQLNIKSSSMEEVNPQKNLRRRNFNKKDFDAEELTDQKRRLRVISGDGEVEFHLKVCLKTSLLFPRKINRLSKRVFPEFSLVLLIFPRRYEPIRAVL